MAVTLPELDKTNQRGVPIFGERRDYDIVVPPDATTHAGFRRWALSDGFPDRGQISFIRGGLVLELGPRPLEYHSCLLGEFVSVLGSVIKEAQLGRFLMRGALLTNLDAEISVEPDAFFVSRESLRRKHVQFVPDPASPKSSKEALGTPDWVLEIVTPTSFRKDKEILREAYYRAGVYEYWIVDPLGKEIKIELLIRGDEGYDRIDIDDGWFASPTFDRSFRMTRALGCDGLPEYELKVAK